MNKVVLYNLKYTMSSHNQPYFANDNARTSFFSNLPNIQVNSDNVNLKPDFNHNFELVCDIDYNTFENYNFAIITYNDKPYYCYIIDGQHIQSNRTRIIFEHCELYDFPNWLSLFKNFQISKATFNKPIYNDNAKMFKPTFRYKKQSGTFELSMDILPGQPVTLDYIPCLQIWTTDLSNIPSPNQTVFSDLNKPIIKYGEPSQFRLLIIPLKEGVENYAIRPTLTTITTFEPPTPTFNIQAVIEILNILSPYIVSVQFTALPFTLISGLPFKAFPMFGNMGIINEVAHPDNKVIVANITNTNLLDRNAEEYYSFYVTNQIFSEVEFKVFSIENSIKLEMSRFSGQNPLGNEYDPVSVFKYSLQYYHDPNGTEILVSIYPQLSDSIQKETHELKYSFPLSDGTSYAIDSTANFWAQNRYYEALTQNAVWQKKWQGGIQSAENFLIAAAQAGTAGFQGSVGEGASGSGQGSLAMGNLIRAGTQIAKTQIDVAAFKYERAALAAQEAEKPNQSVVASSASIRLYEYAGQTYLIESIPFQEDIDFMYSLLHVYGIDCFLFRENINISEFLYNGNFCIKAFAERSQVEHSLTNKEFEQLYFYLSSGIKFELYD